MASAHVEARGAKVLNFDQELSASIIELCRMRKWRWRRGTATFTTVQGSQTYDLSSASPDLEEIDKVYLVEGDGDLDVIPEITEINEIAKALESTTQGDPNGYFRMPDADLTVAFDPVPSGVTKVRLMIWRIPVFLTAQPGSNLIPIIPGFLHPLLVKYLEVRILSYIKPAGDEKYEDSKKELDEMLKAAVENEVNG